MSTPLPDLIDRLSFGALVALATLVVVQLALQIYALVDLSRREAVAGGRKWVWILVIVLGNLLGAVVYLAVARSVPAPAPPGGESTSGPARERALDRLYGRKDGR